MLRAPVLAAFAAVLSLAVPAVAGAQDFGATPGQQRASGVELGRLAYTYGFPLMDLLRIRAENTSVNVPTGSGNAPVNQFSHARRFARPQDRTVVAPNVDTLYSIAHLDLAREPVVLTVPRTGSRYWTFEFVDPYTNVIGYLGRRLNGGRGGRWAITWSGARRAHLPKGIKTLRSRYRRVWVIGRTLVSGGRDMAAARRVQDGYGLAPLSRWRTGRPAPRPKRRVTTVDRQAVPKGLAFLDGLSAALAENPPPARDAAILGRLKTIGVGPGLRTSSAGLPQPVLDGLAAGVDAEAAELGPRTRIETLQKAIANGGWYSAAPNIGDFGTDYVFRAQIAAVGIGANTPVESTYPIALADSAGRLFDGRHRYRMVFPKGQLPPTRAFWSLTMYDLEGFLVATPTQTYAIGDSHPPLHRRADGSVVVLLQRTKPAEKDVNWLPTPTAGFRLNLRLYMPTKAILDGTWRPPAVERLD